MSGTQFMVVLIVMIGVFGGVMKARYEARRHGGGHDEARAAENGRLRGEVAELRQRIQVLERVVTDTEGSARLDREIERLRDNRGN